MTTKIVVKNAKFVETTFADGSKQLVGTVRGDSFVNLVIPTEPNPRQFVGDANPNYKDMVKTLRAEPEMFARKNAAGITMFAHSIDNNGDGSYTVTFGDKDGIANGGHTYHALKVAGTARSQAKVTIEIGLDTDKSIEVATALNLNKKLQSYSLHNKEGAFDWYKQALAHRSKEVIYHEGDQGLLEVKESVSFLHLFKHDVENRSLPLLDNIKQADHGSIPMSQLTANDEKANENKTSLKYIARDVHDIAMFTIFDETMVTQLVPLKKSVGQNWLKTRGGKKSMVKGLALLLVAGLAEVGSGLNKNGIVGWVPKYNSPEARRMFIKKLFDKVSIILPLNSGNVSSIVRDPALKDHVLTFAKMIDKE